MNKKVFVFLFAFITCLLFAACGASGEEELPYLSESEQTEIEQCIRENCSITTNSDSTDANLVFSNTTGYDLIRLELWDTRANTIYFVPFIPNGTAAKIPIYNDLCDEGTESFSLTYTIGDFTYMNGNLELPIEKKESPSSIEFVIQTKEGPIVWDLNEPLELEGKEIDGFTNSKISSLTAEVYSNLIQIECIGDLPEYGALFYKIYNDNTVWKADSIYNYDGQPCYISLPCLEPGRYTLLFIECG